MVQVRQLSRHSYRGGRVNTTFQSLFSKIKSQYIFLANKNEKKKRKEFECSKLFEKTLKLNFYVSFYELCLGPSIAILISLARVLFVC